MALTKIASYARILYHWRLRRSVSLDYPPEDIMVELTNTCNFKCTFCPQSNPDHFQTVARSTLTPEQADVILGKVRAGGVRSNVIHWTLDGEPFINRDIGEICEVAVRHGFHIFIFSTNGFFLTPERVGSLPMGNGAVYDLWIDFCADREYFETYRGTKTSWERVRDNISHALEQDHPSIRFHVTDITSFTERDPERLARNMNDLKALFPSDRIAFHSRVFHNMAGFVPGLVEEKKGGKDHYIVCPYPWATLAVASNGDVVACCRDLDHQSVMGNLFEQDLEEIWNGERFQELRRNLVEHHPEKNSACDGCDLPYDRRKMSAATIVERAVHRLGILR